jgi:S1-C subfamily serine protease
MTARGFTINEVTPYKVVFSRNIQDFFRVLRNTVTFNLMPRDGNIKMMTTQQVSLGSQVEDRPITELIPVIKEVRNSIDGTKLDLIQNEAVVKSPETQSAVAQEEKLGIILIKSEVDGHFRIKEILAKSAAANAGLAVNDEILDINGKVLAELDKNAVDAYISSKWSEGSSLIILYSRNGEQKIVKLKKGGS